MCWELLLPVFVLSVLCVLSCNLRKCGFGRYEVFACYGIVGTCCYTFIHVVWLRLFRDGKVGVCGCLLGHECLCFGLVIVFLFVTCSLQVLMVIWF